MEAPDSMRVLDPFAGSGSLSLEAMLLGCAVYAGDLNPVASRILRATLEYPRRFGPPDTRLIGTELDLTWAGLERELRHFFLRLEDQAGGRVAHLFPRAGGDGPDRYLWVWSVTCPVCRMDSPFDTSIEISRGLKGESMFLVWRDPDGAPTILTTPPRSQPRNGAWLCPRCGAEASSRVLVPSGDARLGAVLRRATRGLEVQPVDTAASGDVAPWTQEDAGRLAELLDMASSSLMRAPLSDAAFKSAIRAGCRTFADIFSPRQLLVLLEYASAARAICAEYLHAGMEPDRVDAVATFGAFFVSDLADRNNVLCRWNSRTRESLSFERPVLTMGHTYVERSTRGAVDAWMSRVLPTLERVRPSLGESMIYVGSAERLPFADCFFDAVITAPPDHDNIPYSELSEFYYAVESTVLTCSSFQPKPTESLHGAQTESRTRAEHFRDGIVAAFREIARVLKPGRKACLFLNSRAAQSALDDYVNLCERAGLSVVDVRALPASAPQVNDGSGGVDTYLVYVRKPYEPLARESGRIVRAEALLAAAVEGRPVLYAGLAELLLAELSEDDLPALLPVGGRGTRIEQVMEVIADQDPRDLLFEHLGRRGVRQVADRFRAAGDPSEPIEVILEHFGFTLPSTGVEFEGPSPLADRLRRLSAKMAGLADDERPVLSGSFLDACAGVERFLRVGIWGWLRLLYGSARDEHLLGVLREADPNRKYELTRLTFGDVAKLLRGLPDHVAVSAEAERLEQKFGRRHLFVEKRARFCRDVDELVALRNKVEHNKNGYRLDTPFTELKADLVSAVRNSSDLVHRLAEEHVVPRVGSPFLEIRDKWNRVSYRLAMDDGTDVEARFSQRLELGACYLYFGTATNPRPVDPCILLASDLGGLE